MVLYIQNMNGCCCKLLVEKMVEEFKLQSFNVEWGCVELESELTDKQLQKFSDNLNKAGMRLLEDENEILIERIKNQIIKMIHQNDEIPDRKISDYLSDRLHYSYRYLSSVFSSHNGLSIQQYVIQQKIEKVKKLLMSNDLTLTEIAYKLRYSSVSHLSSQFKKVTGMNPTTYKERNLDRRIIKSS